MNLVTLLTVLFPLMIAVLVIKSGMAQLPRATQITLGMGLLTIGNLPLLGLFLTIPGGGLTDLGDKQQTMAELLITAAMAPSMGATMLGAIALWRAWRMG